jgi:hypothetical protein
MLVEAKEEFESELKRVKQQTEFEMELKLENSQDIKEKAEEQEHLI